MKYKKVLAMALSAGLSAASLASCSLSPGMAYGMEAAAVGEACEVEGDGAEEGENQVEESREVSEEETPPEEKTAGEGETAGGQEGAEIPVEDGDSSAQPPDDGQGSSTVEPDQKSDDAGDETQPSDESGPASGEETPPEEETASQDNAGNGQETQTPGQEENVPGNESGTEAGSDADTDNVNDYEGAAVSDQGSISGGDNLKAPEETGQTESEAVPAETGVGDNGLDSDCADPGSEKYKKDPSEKIKTGDADTDESDDIDGSDGSGRAWLSGAGSSAGSRSIRTDFRFTQVDKIYALANAVRLARIYEKADVHSAIVGEIPYFGLAFILEEGDGFYYIESGDVRGFIPKEDLTVGSYADETVDLLGEGSFEDAVADVEIPDNDAFTHTLTTTKEVLREKEYALALMEGAVLEYPREGSRAIGTLKGSTLVYILEDVGNGWLYVESGDVRGFIRKESLLMGEGAAAITEDMGEGTLSLAEEIIPPEENRSLYFTLSSVKPALPEISQAICDYALGFEGNLPYIYGGTSLSYGADCSGFTQSIFANFGISIPRTAEEQGVNGEPVDGLGNAKPGDIVYYASGPHVGIYIGDGKVIQCSGNAGNTSENPGKGPTISAVDYMPITSIRRYTNEQNAAIPEMTEDTNKPDGVSYSQEELELIWAIVAQEDNGSYEGALAVITSAMNRAESPVWGYLGDTAMQQLTAPGQYCYSLDNYWVDRLGGNVPEYVKQAVNDCLVKGIRNHDYTSFRSTKGKTTGNDAVQIGGNWFFGS